MPNRRSFGGQSPLCYFVPTRSMRWLVAIISFALIRLLRALLPSQSLLPSWELGCFFPHPNPYFRQTVAEPVQSRTPRTRKTSFWCFLIHQPALSNSPTTSIVVNRFHQTLLLNCRSLPLPLYPWHARTIAAVCGDNLRHSTRAGPSGAVDPITLSPASAVDKRLGAASVKA